MLEESVERAFQEMADQVQPHSRISIQQALREGRTRLRRRRLTRAVGAPLVAASAALAIGLTGALPSSLIGGASKQTGGYGKVVGGAFDPAQLVIAFGWLPKGTKVLSGDTSPGEESLYAYGPYEEAWAVGLYARNVCHVKAATQKFTCLPSVRANTALPMSFPAPITGHGPVINGHRSLWLDGRDSLAWQYSGDAWAVVQHVNSSTDVASVVRIAKAVEYRQPIPSKYGQHVPITFAARFTSLPQGWRIIGLQFNRDDGVYLTWDYQIARLHTISPATPAGATMEPDIQITPANQSNQCAPPRPGVSHREVTIHGYRFTLTDQRIRQHGVVTSYLALCGNHVDGLLAGVSETTVGAHPGFTPAKVMERMKLLGPVAANWVTNPLP